MANMITVDGTITEVKTSLEDLQKAVEGYIEIVDLPKGDLTTNKKLIMVLNEEGKINQLPVNLIATQIWIKNYGRTDVIVGNVVICKRSDIK